ncbi:MAG: hypothetical protein KIT22_05320 [Verrucomicrobiae bacterium]|nr:hypothetical protein [Verrucomicrobiae bacterium]
MSEAEENPAVTQPVAPSGGTSFSAFRLISERNIFNPNRSQRSSEAPAREQRRVPVVETFSLVGTLSHGDRLVAFFDGSSSHYRKACKPDEAIAGYKVVAIQSSEVTLEADGRTVSLAVGNQMRREDEGPWQAAGTFTATATSTGSGETTSRRGGVTGDRASSGARADSSGASASGGDESDVLKRLREKRAQETKNEKP